MGRLAEALRGNGADELAQMAAVDLVVFLRALESDMSELVAQLRGMAINDTLFSGDVVLDATGAWTMSFSVPYASVAVDSQGSAAIVVTSGSPQVAAPTGAGAHIIGPGGKQGIVLTGRDLTIYGAAGTQVSVQVFTKPINPFAAGTNTVLTAASAQLVSRLHESSAPLLAAATFNGATRDTNPAPYSRFRAFAAADVGGTLSVQQSTDGVTWYTTLSVPLGAGSPTILESLVTLRYIRMQVVNGAANQTTFEADSTLLAI